MDTRTNILNTITAAKPTRVSLPEIDITAVIQYPDKVAQFQSVVESIGGKVAAITTMIQLKEEIEKEMQAGNFIVNTLAELGEVDDRLGSLTADQLAGVHKSYIKGMIGVAENGAVWISESQLTNRLLPFICQHLVLVIERKNIVATMHHAYRQVDTFREGFGVFIAGPSKTADIEQSLVIGAHGARSLELCILAD